MAKKKSDGSGEKTPGETKAELDRKAYDVPPEKFIEVWQTSNSADEVSQRLGMPKPIVHARASNYRQLGIKLKKMPRTPRHKLDVAHLNRLIEELDRNRPRQK
jgi:hypothetical protein